MHITYDSIKDLLYLRLDERTQDVENRRVAEDIVLDIGQDEKVVGIEILDASQHVRLDGLFLRSGGRPVQTASVVCEDPGPEYGSQDKK